MLALLALPVSLLGMQQTIAERLDGRVPPDVGALVQRLGVAASARGLPVDPLIQKAIEGSAKGVPAERISSAGGPVGAPLGTSAGGVRGRGGPNHTPGLPARAVFLHTGISAHEPLAPA